MRFLSVQFSREDLQALAEDAFPTSPRLAFFDARLLALARVFEAECRADQPSDPLQGDGLALRLAALLSNSEPTRGAYRGGLTARQVKRVKEYLEGHLCEAVDLAELARVAGLSPSHFQRAFRATLGAPPHRWLTGRRIRRAQEFMRDPRRTLAEIAIDTGFADQPHFTRVFSKVVGATPGVWRRTIVE